MQRISSLTAGVGRRCSRGKAWTGRTNHARLEAAQCRSVAIRTLALGTAQTLLDVQANLLDGGSVLQVIGFDEDEDGT